MSELTVILILLLPVIAIVGAIVGWIAHDRRTADKQDAVKTMWREQIEMHRKARKRLAAENKNLMEQINQQQVQQSRLRNSAAELSSAMRDASIRRDELQRDIHSRDVRIDVLTRNLRNWQERLPPLVDRYRERDEEAEQLEMKLEETLTAIRRLEEERRAVAERAVSIEPLRNTGHFTDGLEASNDEDDEYVDEVDGEETPVFLDESTMIDGDAILDDEQAHATETVDEQAHATETVDEQDAHAAEIDDDQQVNATEIGDDLQVRASETGDDRKAHGAQTDDAGDPAPDDAEDSPRQHDNLRMIKGVGPAIEKTLNEMGIISYRQIADMTDYDIDRIARRLQGFQDRIEREDWIGQARALLDKAAMA